MAVTAKEGCDKMTISLYFRLRRGGKVFCDKSSVEVVGWGGGGRGEMAAQRRILPLIILLAAQLATGETS